MDRLENFSGQYEVIWLDDHSNDDSVALLRSILPNDDRFRIVSAPGEGKKAALALGVSLSTYSIILCLDADVLPENGWPSGMVHPFVDSKVNMVCGDVSVTPNDSLVSRFDQIDTFSLVASGRGLLGVGWAVMCNGANLAYRKSAFEAVGGYSGNEHISSGDDVFLMHTFMAEDSESVVSASLDSDSGVTTYPGDSWKDVFRQRIRWAGKSTSYTSIQARIIALYIGGLSGLITVGLPMSIFISDYTFTILQVWMVKVIIDTILLMFFSKRYRQNLPLPYVFLQSVVHPFYTFGIAIMSPFVKVKWKGRQASVR